MRKNQIQPLGSIITEYLKKNRMNGKLAEVSAIEAWQEVMGQSIHRATREITIRQGILVVHLNSAALRNELFMRRGRIRDLLNEHVGVQVIRDVIIK